MPNRILSTLSIAIFLACGGSSARPDDPGSGPANDGPMVADQEAIPSPGPRLPEDVIPQSYELTLEIDPRQETFRGTSLIEVDLREPRSIVYLHAKNLRVSEVSFARQTEELSAAEWHTVDEESGVAAIRFPRELEAATYSIRIAYEAPFDGGLEGIYRVEQSGEHYAFSQMEPLSARRAFPCFDEPAFKTPYSVTLIVDESHSAIANGRERTSEPLEGNKKRVTFARTQPLPTYLLAFAVGPFDVVDADPIPPSAVRPEPIPLRGVATRGQGPRLAYALRHTPALLDSLERYFGVGYAYDKLDLIAIPDFGAGAMENAGAITFRDSLLLVGEDAPMWQRRAFAFVNAHELAHQWFGNLVTMRWWDDLWLNEAFATWAETHTVAEVFPELGADISETMTLLEAMDADSLSTARRIRQPIESEHDIHNAFDDITYNKGASVIAMFEHFVGADTFRQGVQSYLTAHLHGIASADDFFGEMNRTTRRPIGDPFRTFVDRSGVPLLEVTPRCEDGVGSVEVRQSRYSPLGANTAADDGPWQVPFCVRYAAGRETARECMLITQAVESVNLPRGCPRWVMPNADGAGYYRFTLPADALASLTRSLRSLSVRETIVFADSIQAGYEAGRISFADAMRALEPLTQREERALALAPTELLTFAIQRVLSGEERDRARERAARLYASRVRRLGWTPRANENPDTASLRANLFNFVALIARDPALRREAAQRGRAYVGFGADNEIHEDAVTPDLAELSLIVALQEDGALFDPLVSILASSQDPVVRSNVIRALAEVRDPALRRRSLELALDERARMNETFKLLQGPQAGDPEGMDAAWGWFTEHYAAISGRIGPGFSGYLPFFGAGFCSADRAREVREFFAPRVGATQGGPRNLETTMESIGICAARLEHARQSAASYFAP